MLPYHFFFTRLAATCNLLLVTCQRKNLIFRGTLLLQIYPATLLVIPLLVKNLYKDFVENVFLFLLFPFIFLCSSREAVVDDPVWYREQKNSFRRCSRIPTKKAIIRSLNICVDARIDPDQHTEGFGRPRG